MIDKCMATNACLTLILQLGLALAETTEEEDDWVLGEEKSRMKMR